MIKNIKAQIGFARMPLTDIIGYLILSEEFGSLTFLKNVNLYLSKGNSFCLSWKNSVKSFIGINGLTKEDAEILMNFGENLGGSDTKGQIENCDTYIELLSLRIERLKTKAQSKVKIYNSMGVLAAALVIILLS